MRRANFQARDLMVACAVTVIVTLCPFAWADVRAGDVSARNLQGTSTTEMKIFTDGGFVSFAAGRDWPVLLMEPKLPVATAVFQLPNPAEQGTPDSSNLVLMLCAPHSEKGRAAYGAPVQQYGEMAPREESFHGWTIYRQKAKQDGTIYTILDAKREGIADVSVKVRLAWPHLAANSSTYDKDMEAAWQAFLGSISGSTGGYTPASDEVVRRPRK